MRCRLPGGCEADNGETAPTKPAWPVRAHETANRRKPGNQLPLLYTRLRGIHPTSLPVLSSIVPFCAIIGAGLSLSRKSHVDAFQNILLACHALGLGAVWIGVYPRDERVTALRELMRLPVTVTPLCAIAIGRPAAHPAPVERFRPDRIHQEQW